MEERSESSRKQLTNAQREGILKALLEQSEDRKLKRGAINKIANNYNVTRNTVSRIWKRANESLDQGSKFMDVRSRKSNSGRKRKIIDLSALDKIPLDKRGSIRSAALALSIPKSTLFRSIQRGEICRHSLCSQKKVLVKQNKNKNQSKDNERLNDIVKNYFENKSVDNEIEIQVDKCIEEEASKISSFVIETRRELHKNPELMYKEAKTSQIIQNILKSLNISYRTGYAKNTNKSTIPGEGGYGIIADIGTGEPPCVLLRTDMDALPLTEETPIINFQSKNRGCMHACGHDGHMSMLLGAARILKSMESKLKGTVRLMFQPAEEGGAGAKRMREEGVLTIPPAVEMAFGMHVWPTLPSGVIGGREGAQLASSCLFQIDIVGVGGHAAMPHLTVDPIVAGSALITQLQTLVSRVLNPLDTGVLSITYFQAGDGAYNVIPKTATLRGTIRALSTQTMQNLKLKMEQMVHAIVIEAHGCSEAKVSYPMKDDYPPTVNDSNVWRFAKEVASRISIEGHVRDVEPTMGAEDFAFIAEAVPSTFLFLGSGGTIIKDEEKKQDGDEKKETLKTDYGLHHPKFALDENVLSLGVRLHTNFAIKGLKKLAREMSFASI